MTDLTLEDHLDEICPRCGKEHKAKWDLEHDNFRTYTIIKCEDCSYKIFKKTPLLATALD